MLTRRGFAKTLAAAGIAAGTTAWTSQAAAESNPPADGHWVQVHPGVWRATLGTPEAFTPVASRIVPASLPMLNRLHSGTTPPSLEIRGERQSRGYRLQLPLEPAEQVYGLGLQMMGFAHRGQKLTARVNADPRFNTGDSHAPVPFYASTEGYAILVDTARYASFYFGDARPRPTHSISLTTGNINPAPRYTQELGDRQPGQIVIDIPAANGADIYLFAGPDMLTAVRRYVAFSGGGCLPPEWGLGFWYRMDATSTQTSALHLAREFRDRNIPCDVLGLEPGWQTHAYSCTFVWNRDRFPDPSSFVRDAADLGYKVNLWEHAFTHPASPLFPTLLPHSGDFGVWGGLVPDFAGQPARQIFGDYHGTHFVDQGVSGFKLDECDNSDFTGGWSFPECSRFPSGIDGEQMHSVFGLRYQQAIWEQYRKRNQETYGLVRSSGALAAPYPFVLYSDLYDHRVFIRALVNSGFSGLLWCPEVRDAVDQEDLIRRLQSVVFSPLAMVNGWYIKNPPWKQLNKDKNNAGELLPDWEKLEASCRTIIGWRMQLVPYLRWAFARYAKDGTPPFRALVLDFPRDPRLQQVDDQYLIGDSMMVAPLFAGEAERKITIPPGQWHDFWSGAKVEGSATTVLASFERIPVYVKAGSLIPWAGVGQHSGSPESRQITVRVYGDGSLPATLTDRRNEARLTWSNGAGRVEGQLGSYIIKRWQQIGP